MVAEFLNRKEKRGKDLKFLNKTLNPFPFFKEK
jgi:hypothetical protein